MIWNAAIWRSAHAPQGIWIAIAICLLLTTRLLNLSHAASSPALTVVTEHLPPYNYQDGASVKGVATEVTRALLQEVGLQADIQILPWARAYLQALEKPNVLIFSIVRTPDRENLFHWIGKVSTSKSYLFKLADRDDIQIRRLEDAKSYLIGVWREDVREQYLLKRGFVRPKQLDNSGTPSQNIQKLFLRRLDLVADSELSFYFQLNQLNYVPNLVKEAFELKDVSLPFYIAFSKKTSPNLVEAFRHALKRVKRKGIFQAIHQKYIGVASQVPGVKP